MQFVDYTKIYVKAGDGGRGGQGNAHVEPQKIIYFCL